MPPADRPACGVAGAVHLGYRAARAGLAVIKPQEGATL
jgi:hypothetical protein